MSDLYDVVAVNQVSGKVRFLAEGKTERNAEAIIRMAVYRRGVDEEFYSAVTAGSYHEGDEWRDAR